MRKIILSIFVILCTAVTAWGALDDLRQKAAAGDTKAQYNLAYALLTGDGVEADYTAAMEWAAQSAAGGNVDANGLIGYMYYMGLGVEQDYAQAFRNYVAALTEDDPDMLMRLGFCYLRGQGIAQNTALGLEMMERAAALDDAYAMFTLGMLYYEGSDVPMDWALAKTWFAKSVSERHVDGAVVLCRIYMAEGRNVECLMWYAVLAALAPQRADTLQEGMEVVLAEMTDAERAEGLSLAKNWLAEYTRARQAAASLTEGKE